MLEISDLGLTPRQFAEVEDADQTLVQEWLERVSRNDVTNPAAWFLTGLRSGEHPEEQHDRERARRTHLAENWMANVGLLLDREGAVVDDLFGRNGLLYAYAGDEKLQRRMVLLWKRHRPDGEQVEREFLARAGRNAETFRVLHTKERDESGSGERQAV